MDENNDKLQEMIATVACMNKFSDKSLESLKILLNRVNEAIYSAEAEHKLEREFNYIASQVTRKCAEYNEVTPGYVSYLVFDLVKSKSKCLSICQVQFMIDKIIEKFFDKNEGSTELTLKK